MLDVLEAGGLEMGVVMRDRIKVRIDQSSIDIIPDFLKEQGFHI